MALENYLSEIFQTLENGGVSYCHWKSNSHLDDSFAGETDFDILVARDSVEKFREVLTRYNMKRRWSTADKAYNFMEDFVGVCPETSAMFHFHLHYRLIMGEKLDKNYVIPIDQEVLRDSIIDPNFGIRIISPEWEQLLLMIRILLKTDLSFKNIIKQLLGKQIAPRNIDEEYFHLERLTDDSLLQRHLGCPFVLPKQILAVPKMLGMVKKSNVLGRVFDGIRFFLLKARVKSVLKAARVRSGKEHRKEKKARAIYSQVGVRGSSKGGFSIAFIGADGSGKSTTVEMIKKWLCWKYSVAELYMGIPKKSFVLDKTKPLVKILKKLKIDFLIERVQNLRWLYLAYFRYQQYLKSIELKNSGHIVIMDRYPHPAFNDMKEPMDGPRIKSSSIWSKYERGFYNKINSPDIIFVLKVTLEESVRRKKEHESEQLQEMIKGKIVAIDKLCKTDAQVIEINSCRERDVIIREIKAYIWEKI